MNETTTQNTHTESPVAETPSVRPVSSYSGWLVSDDLIKRSIAVFLHSLLGQLIIVVPAMIVFYILAFIVVGINI